MSFKPLVKMYMFTSKKRPISQLGPFEKPKILVVIRELHSGFD